MAKRFPREFRDEVVAVARKREAPILQIARDFGISDATLHNWLKAAEVEDGFGARTTVDDHENRELKKRVRLLEQENEVLRRAAIYLGKDVLPK